MKDWSLSALRRALVLLLLIGGAEAWGANSAEAIDSAIGRAVEKVAPRVVQLRYFGGGRDALGGAAAPVTGYALDEHWIVTSTYALADDPAGVLCRFADGTQTQARVVARDHSRLVALLCTDGRAAAPPPLAGRPAHVGETVIALGRVYAADSVNVSVGVVSAVGRLGGRTVQTDALVSPTNYGGPLVGLDGALLGIITPAAPPGQRGVDLYDSGVGFAAVTEAVAARLPKLAAGDDVHPGWLGVSLAKGDPLRAPATLLSVAEGGPADEAGLEEGDVVVSLGGVGVDTIWSLRRTLAGFDADAEVEVTVRRPRAGEKEASEQLRRVVRLGLAPPPEEPDETQVLEAIKKPDEP